MAALVLTARAHPFDVAAFLAAHPHIIPATTWQAGSAPGANSSGFSMVLASNDDAARVLAELEPWLQRLGPALDALRGLGAQPRLELSVSGSPSLLLPHAFLVSLASAGLSLELVPVSTPQPPGVVSLAQAAEQVSAWRLRGQSVALANGVFDLFHVGHLRYLEGAAQLADRLVVAVNSDASTRAYKGPGRPLVPEAERAEILAGLSCTDLVLVFDEPDVRAVIRALKPDVHVKGTDYTPASIPERAEVEAYGGRVAVAGDPKDHSTTALVAKLGN